MKKRLLAALCVCAAGTASAGLHPGDAAPPSLGVELGGKGVKVAHSAGKVTVVSFWASWCAPCRRELPLLEGLQRAGWGRVQVVAVNIDERENFRPLARRLASLALKVTHDDGNRVQEAYGVKGIPHTVVIGRDGRVLLVVLGYSEDSIDEILEEVNGELAAK